MQMLGCYYASVSGWAFGWTQSVPLIVTVCLALLSMATNEAVYFLFGLFLYVPQHIVWCFQQYFQMIRPDPVCQIYHTWAFPSIECMYIGAIVGFFVAYTIAWGINHPWLMWLMVYLLGIVPAATLWLSGYNRWWEIVFSWVFGFLSSIFFGMILRLFIRPMMPYLRLSFPLLTLGYVDHMCAGEDEERSQAILESLERLDRL